MLNCRELSYLVSSGELDEAHGWKRLSARLHLVMCRYCRRYESQVLQVNAAARASLRSVQPTVDALERLERRILHRSGDD